MERERDPRACREWLQNKLGAEDGWNAAVISSLLTTDTLVNIRKIFGSLEPHLRVKVILAIISMKRKDIDAATSEVKAILDLAAADSNEWVQVVYEIVKDYPSMNTLHASIGETGVTPVVSFFQKGLDKVFHTLSDAPSSRVLPQEALYLNSSIVADMLADCPRVAHFRQRKRPKPATIAVAPETAKPVLTSLPIPSAWSGRTTSTSSSSGFHSRPPSHPRDQSHFLGSSASAPPLLSSSSSTATSAPTSSSTGAAAAAPPAALSRRALIASLTTTRKAVSGGVETLSQDEMASLMKDRGKGTKRRHDSVQDTPLSSSALPSAPAATSSVSTSATTASTPALPVGTSKATSLDSNAGIAMRLAQSLEASAAQPQAPVVRSGLDVLGAAAAAALPVSLMPAGGYGGGATIGPALGSVAGVSNIGSNVAMASTSSTVTNTSSSALAHVLDYVTSHAAAASSSAPPPSSSIPPPTAPYVAPFGPAPAPAPAPIFAPAPPAPNPLSSAAAMAAALLAPPVLSAPPSQGLLSSGSAPSVLPAAAPTATTIQPTDDLETIRTKLLALLTVSDADKAIFTAFATNQPSPVEGKDVFAIVYHQGLTPVPEQHFVEITFSTRQWRLVRRKRRAQAAAAQ